MRADAQYVDGHSLLSSSICHCIARCPPQASAEGMSAKLEEGGKILAEAVQSLKVDPKKLILDLNKETQRILFVK